MRHLAPSLLRLAAPCALFVFLCASSGGCQILAGLGGEETLAATGGSGGSGGSGPAGGSGGTTGSTSETGGSGGTGLTGPCSPGDQQACYTGPDGTEGVGACVSGKASCTDEGMWGTCEGQVVPQFESCATTADDNCDSYDCAIWVKVLGGEVYGDVVTVDAEGNVLVAVTFYAGVDFGDGQPAVPVGNGDVALLKFDKHGALTWKKAFPIPGEQEVRAIAVDASGNIAIGGDSNTGGDYGTGQQPPGAFVVKMDSSGTPLWTRVGTFTGAGSGAKPTITHLDFDSKGHVYAGGSGLAIDFGTGTLSGGDPTNFFIAKLDSATGAPIWSRITKGGGNEVLRGLQVDPSDSVVLTGTWNSQYMGLSTASQMAVNDHYNCCGQHAPFLLRLDPNGANGEAKMLAGYSPISAQVEGMGLDKFGAAIIAGSFDGYFDLQSGPWDAGMTTSYFVLRDVTSGFGQWSKVLVGDPAVSTNANLVAIDGHDNIVLSGNHYGPADFGGGLLSKGSHYLLKLDKDGNHLWSRGYSFGDGGIRGLAAGTLDDETVIIGTFYGSADLGTGPIKMDQGFFIAKLGK